MCLFIYGLIIFCALFIAYMWHSYKSFYFIQNFAVILQLLDYIKAGVTFSLIILLMHFLINAIETILDKRFFKMSYYVLTFCACLLNLVLFNTLFQNVNYFLRIAVTNQDLFYMYLSTQLTISMVSLALLFLNVMYIYKKECKMIYKY